MTSDVMKQNCLLTLGVFRQEIEIVQPRAMVLYVGTGYDCYMGKTLFGERWRDREGSDKGTKVQCGNKAMPWWEGEIQLDGDVTCRVLRTGHPERKNKHDFVKLVVEWLEADSNSAV
jgi:hypothetical protein